MVSRKSQLVEKERSAISPRFTADVLIDAVRLEIFDIGQQRPGLRSARLRHSAKRSSVLNFHLSRLSLLGKLIRGSLRFILKDVIDLQILIRCRLFIKFHPKRSPLCAADFTDAWKTNPGEREREL